MKILFIVLSVFSIGVFGNSKLRAGDRCYLKKDYYEAIKQYNEAQVSDPENIKVFFNRGNAFFRFQKYPKAAADYSRVISHKNSKRYWQALYNRGCSYLAMGRPQLDRENLKKARDDFRAAAILRPRNLDIRKNLQIAAILLKAEKQQQKQNRQGPGGKDPKNEKKKQQKGTPGRSNMNDPGNMEKNVAKMLIESARQQEKKTQQEYLKRQNPKRADSGEW